MTTGRGLRPVVWWECLTWFIYTMGLPAVPPYGAWRLRRRSRRQPPFSITITLAGQFRGHLGPKRQRERAAAGPSRREPSDRAQSRRRTHGRLSAATRRSRTGSRSRESNTARGRAGDRGERPGPESRAGPSLRGPGPRSSALAQRPRGTRRSRTHHNTRRSRHIHKPLQIHASFLDGNQTRRGANWGRNRRPCWQSSRLAIASSCWQDGKAGRRGWLAPEPV
jgi:hypothetical protein